MIILYKENETKFDHLGIGVLKDAISCHVAESLNDSFELELEYPILGQLYSEIKIDSIIYSKSSPTSNPQPFRVYSISKPLNGIVKIHALHLSYDMNGIIISPIKEGNLQDVLKQLENNSLLPHNFKFYSKVQSTKTYSTNRYFNLRALLFGSEESILETYKLEIEFDNYNVYLTERRGSDKNAEIRYGKNMTELEHEFTHDLLYNYVYPYYHKETSSQTTSTAAGEFKKAYIVGSKPLQDGWLSFEENGEPYHPVDEAPIQIATDGDYYNKVFTWDSTRQKYKERLYDQQVTLIEGVTSPEWIEIGWQFPNVVVKAKKDGYFKSVTDTEYKHYNIGDIVFSSSLRTVTTNLVLYYSEVIPPTESSLNDVSTSVAHTELTNKLLKVDTDLANKMTFNRILNLDLTNEFEEDEEVNDETLTKKALKFIQENKIGQYKYNTTVSFADLSSSEEDVIYKNLESVELGDTIKVVYEALDINVELRVITVSYDVLLDKYSSIELGEKSDTISSSSVQTGDNISSLTNDKGFTDEKTVASIIAKTVTADYIEATNAKLSKAQIEDLETARIKISGMLEASQAEIDMLVAKMLIAENAVIKKTLEAGEVKVSGDITVKSGEISIQNDDGSKVFRVDREGNLYANSAVIQGKIEAAEGHIGGFNITETAIWNNIESMYSENENGVYIGPDGISLGKQLKIYPNGLILSHTYTDQSTMAGLLVPDPIKPSIQKKKLRSISSFNGIILGAMTPSEVNNIIKIAEYTPGHVYVQNEFCIYENQMYRQRYNTGTPAPETFQPSQWAPVNEYSESSVYVTGNYCIYKTEIYKCLSNTDGAFDPTKWELIGEYLDLRSNYIVNISSAGTITNVDNTVFPVLAGDNITVKEVIDTKPVWRKMDSTEFDNVYNYINNESVNQLNTVIAENCVTGDIYKIVEDERIISATEYNPEFTYNTDDICIHTENDVIKYYICLEDNVTGTWDPSKWSLINLDDYHELENSDGTTLLVNVDDTVIFVRNTNDETIWKWTKYYVNNALDTNYFGLTPDGILYANGAIISGDITVKSGEISIESDDGNKVFRVDREGNLYATSATIKGRIEADEGHIADFTIRKQGYYDTLYGIYYDSETSGTDGITKLMIAVNKYNKVPFIHMDSYLDDFTDLGSRYINNGYVDITPGKGVTASKIQLVSSLTAFPAWYWTSKVYNVGSYCRNGGHYYKCLVNNTTGPFNPSKWELLDDDYFTKNMWNSTNILTFNTLADKGIEIGSPHSPVDWYNNPNFVITFEHTISSTAANNNINLWNYCPNLYNIVGVQMTRKAGAVSTSTQLSYELVSNNAAGTGQRMDLYKQIKLHGPNNAVVFVSVYCCVLPYNIEEGYE